MLRVTIEVLPEGDDTRDRTLALMMTIANEGTGTATNGQYDVQLVYVERDGSTFTKTAPVTDYERAQYSDFVRAVVLPQFGLVPGRVMTYTQLRSEVLALLSRVTMQHETRAVHRLHRRTAARRKT